MSAAAAPSRVTPGASRVITSIHCQLRVVAHSVSFAHELAASGADRQEHVDGVEVHAGESLRVPRRSP